MHCFSVASLGGCQNSKEYPAEALHVALVDFAHLCHRVALSKACKQPTSCICLAAYSRTADLYCAAVKAEDDSRSTFGDQPQGGGSGGLKSSTFNLKDSATAHLYLPPSGGSGLGVTGEHQIEGVLRRGPNHLGMSESGKGLSSPLQWVACIAIPPPCISSLVELLNLQFV